MMTDRLTGSFPNRGLRYPKASEKPPFQTWAEFSRQIQRGGLSDAEQSELWDCLYLTLPEVDELLRLVKQQALQPFIYPMFVFAAHTGARRSEIVRSRIGDLDFEANMVTIRERKRVHSQTTTRRVPMTPLLAEVLKEWLNQHPGGAQTFCQPPGIIRSKTVRSEPTPVTHYLGMVLVQPYGELRAMKEIEHTPTVNDLANLLAESMRRPGVRVGLIASMSGVIHAGRN
jgi:integrase